MNLVKIAEEAFEEYKTSASSSPKSLNDAWAHYENSIDTSHGPEHIKSVLNYAQEIGKQLSLDPEDIEYAAVLHDIAREDDVINGTNNHEFTGVDHARPYISHLSPRRQRDILDAIRHHRSTTGRPNSDLARIISDADRLSSIDKLHERSLDYHMNVKGLPRERALTKSYWNLRHSKLKRLRTGRDFHTEQAKQIFDNKLNDIREKTKTFEGYKSMFSGSSESVTS